ncbi:MAG: ABC transporter substrate-binding protein [Eubacteriales bacterium]|nr:ABC transporter substrate-binding protein [Eubacteriales bacterium]
MKKKVAALVLSVMTVASMTVPALAADTVKIGIFEPLSGDNGAGGKQEILGEQFANSETPTVEIGGKEYKVELDIVDNESNNDKAVSAASKLVSDGVSIVLGSYGSGVSIVGGQIFQEGGLPAVGITCTNPQVTLSCPNYYRMCFLDPFQGTVLANFANDNLEAKTAYVLTKQGDDYSAGLGHYFTEAFEDLGGKVITETFPEGNSDFTSYLTSAKNAGADVIMAPISIEAAALVIEQASAQGIDLPFVTPDTWDSNVVLNTAKGKDIEIYVTTFYQEGGNETFDAGMKDFINSDSTNLANNGGDDTVAAVTAMGYDAYYLALEALKAADSTDPADVLAALPTLEYDGVCGKVVFDENGDAKRDAAFLKSVNTETGTWDFVGEQKVSE